MNKTELISAMAEHAQLTKVDTGKALDALLASVASTLKADDSLVLVGFGTFSVKARSARTGRNPQTGQEITIPATRVPTFKAGKTLKDKLNG